MFSYTALFQTITEFIKRPKKQELLFSRINVSSVRSLHHTSHYTSWINLPSLLYICLYLP